MNKRTFATTLALAVGAALPLSAYNEYRKNFMVRMTDSTGFTEYYLKENPDLDHEEFSCPSDKGPLIKGLILRPKDVPQALIVMTHGYNMSCENYMPLAHHFVKQGFVVLMFDGIGIGMSEGKGILGLPQHILDMRSMLDMVYSDPEFSLLPLLLFGHSWGGYAACCISALSKYPIQGILTCGAFRKSLSSMIPTIYKRYSHIAPVLVKAVEVMESIIFGKTASITSSYGLKKACCPARLYHSTDDTVVGYEESFVTMKRELADRENIEFVTMEGRNHDLYLIPENDKRQRAIHKELARTTDPAQREALTAELWALMSETDEDLAAEFTEFFNSCLN